MKEKQNSSDVSEMTKCLLLKEALLELESSVSRCSRTVAFLLISPSARHNGEMKIHP